MKILLILITLSTLLYPTYAKTQEETAACIAAIIVASMSLGTTEDSTGCTDCLGLCSKGDEAAQIFYGYTQDCTNQCNCPGVYASIKTATQTDNCKLTASKLIGLTGIMLFLVMALLI